MPDATNVTRTYRRIRWSLLDARDRLREIRPQTLRTDLARMSLTPIIYLLSIPIYLTRRPQAGFAQHARRRGDRYIDSYARFKRNVRFTVDFVTITIVAVALAIVAATFLRNETAPATESSRVFHVGILKRADSLDPLIESFKRDLAERGYSEGERIIYDEPVNAGDEAALEAVAVAFVSQKKDLILAVGDMAAQAVKIATRQIHTPTVFYANFDPIEDRLIASYASSENNFVGVGGGALVKRQVELLERIAPAMLTLGVMSVLADGTNQGFIHALKAATVGEQFTLRLETITTAEDIPVALDALAAAGATAIYLAPSTVTAPRLEFVAQEVLARKMILVGNSPKNAQAGALFALMADLESVGQQLALQADQIFLGVLPSHMSSDFPAASSLELNLTTAKALHLSLPADIIERADVRY